MATVTTKSPGLAGVRQLPYFDVGLSGVPESAVFGPARYPAINLGNLRVGINGANDYVTAFAFVAEYYDTPTSIRVYTPNDGGGYAGGSGGIIRARIFPANDNGTPRTTYGPVATGSYTAGLTAGEGGDNFPVITLTASKRLVMGGSYCCVFDNTDETADDFSSVNCGVVPRSTGSPTVFRGAFAERVLVGVRTGGTTSFPASWEERTVAGVAGGFYSPLYQLTYSGGDTQGFISLEPTGSIAARTYVATNAAPIRERVYLSRGRIVSRVRAMTAAVVGGTCLVELLAADGTTVLASATITQTAADDATDTSMQVLPHRDLSLGTSVFLETSTEYFVRFTPQTTATFRFATCSNGSREAYGSWVGNASWTQSKTQVYTGAAWRDIYVYDHAQSGYGDTFMVGFGLQA